jgi:AhpD family alkylhydroperoxidase
MARIPLIEPEAVDGELEEFYGAVTALLGRVPHFYRTISHAPLLAMLFLPINAANQRQWPGAVVIKTSHVNGCDYCYAHNTSLGQAAGITHEQIIDLSSDDYLDSGSFSEREKAAVLWAEHVTRNTAQKRGDIYERVKAQFSDAEIVELTLICAMFNMINRVNDALDITIEEQPEIDKIKPSLVLDPERMSTYLHWLADNWLQDFDAINQQAEDAAAA